MNRIISTLILICGLVLGVGQITRARAQDESYTLVLLPDTQYYASEYPEILKAQTQWIVENRAALNIVYVAGLGDLTNLGDSAPAEWQNVWEAVSVLDAADVPYGLAVGNHDQSPMDNPDGTTELYNRYFGVEHFTGRDWYGGSFDASNDSHYDLIDAGELQFIIIHLEHGATYETELLAWADGLLKSNRERIGAEILHGLANTPGVTAIEARYNVWVKIDGQAGKQYPINLNSIGPLDEMQVDKLVFEQGKRALGYKEIYLERQGAEGLGLKPGDTLDLVLNDGRTRTLTVAGTVHDVTANPFKFTDSTAGYVTPKTMEWLGESSQFNFFTIATSGSQTDVAHIRTIAEDVAVRIERSGYQVANISINNPGKHPAQSIIDIVLMLMSVLGFMAVLLSGFLIINTMTALMGQHIRQIGVLKAIGATVFQLIGMYILRIASVG